MSADTPSVSINPESCRLQQQTRPAPPIAALPRPSLDEPDTEQSPVLVRQEVDLQRWIDVHAFGQPVHWYRDKVTGKTMDRQQLELAMLQKQVSSIVVWRLDRLRRTAAGLTKLSDQLILANINLGGRKSKAALCSTDIAPQMLLHNP